MLAIPYTKNKIGFVVLYAFTFFFSNFGPNTTTFIVPAEIFPARLRSTCRGISAAIGKIGAIAGSLGFSYASESKSKTSDDAGYTAGIGMRNKLLILAGINVAGVFFYLIGA